MLILFYLVLYMFTGGMLMAIIRFISLPGWFSILDSDNRDDWCHGGKPLTGSEWVLGIFFFPILVCYFLSFYAFVLVAIVIGGPIYLTVRLFSWLNKVSL